MVAIQWQIEVEAALAKTPFALGRSNLMRRNNRRTLKPKPPKPFPLFELKPTVEAKVSQYLVGAWSVIYSNKVDWNLELDLHKTSLCRWKT